MMFKTILYIQLILFSSWGLAGDYISYPVPIYKNNLPVASSLYLKIKSAPVGLSYQAFKAQAKSDSDKLFVQTMDALRGKDKATFRQLLKKRDGLSSDKQINDYLNTFNKMYDGFKELTVLNKLLLKDRIIYVWGVEVKGRKIATGHFFEKTKNGYLYKDFDNISDVEILVKQVVVKSFYLPNLYVATPDPKKQFEVELEGHNASGIGAFLQFDGHFDYLARVNNHYATTNKTLKADKGTQQVVSFYSDMQKKLSEQNFDSFFNGLSSKSKKRIGGIPKKQDMAQVSHFLANQLLPSTIVFVLDAEPFYLVLGTNFTEEFGQAIAEENQAKRMKIARQVPFNYNYVEQNKGRTRFVGVMYTGYLDRVLKENNFLARKVIAPLLVY
ncbi:hypothetical protein [Thalassomonas haliotis]|uniref:Uncharacterized protein n=1 Tax=Thalassomonas haliotis TaxID=485448 RepID=A0ABY7VKB9_9GAMM|nr:hypothetical protein [Thalassomonas haliotis]WDE13107.1 hypothetical protein H3N35_06585 [Thalassomonas haliotis]